MKTFILTIIAAFLFSHALFSQERPFFTLYGTKLVNDSNFFSISFDPTSFKPSFFFSALISRKETKKLVLHTTKKGRAVEGYFFPGLSDRKALVIGGMHGSELSSTEVARALIKKLSESELPYYNVIVIPSLFPDNAQEALKEGKERIENNTGRYTTGQTADPNRQMPPLGKPFLFENPVDAMKREIEGENVALLQLIQSYHPDRVISIHAIRDVSKAGVFADPRTDCGCYALGFDTEKALALMMAQHIQAFGGACPGNKLNEDPTTLYYLDPAIAEPGKKQDRSFNGSNTSLRGQGVSLGSWCSIAVCDPDRNYVRPAIRTFTMEFPGYKLPSEYKREEECRYFEKMVEVYAASIRHYFLHSFFVEGEADINTRFASN